MANFLIEEFKKYKVTLYSNTKNNHELYAIHLKLPSGEAILKFGDVALDENSHTETVNNRSKYILHFHANRFPAFIDILRNEKPLFFYFNIDLNQGYITTSDEPVGEGEIEQKED